METALVLQTYKLSPQTYLDFVYHNKVRPPTNFVRQEMRPPSSVTQTVPVWTPTPLLQRYLSRWTACFAVFFYPIQCQFCARKAKRIHYVTLCWGLEKPATRVTWCLQSPSSVSGLVLSPLCIETSIRVTDMRWPEQHAGKLSAQFTQSDKERLRKCEHGRSSYLQSAKHVWNL